MSVLTLASDPQDAQALDDAEAHHARLAGELAVHVKTLLAAVDRDPDGDAARPRTALVAFCDRALLPHAGAEEAALYPAARAMPEARLLIESLTGEHRRLTALVDALRSTAPDPVRTAADAGALQVLFEEHVTKENGLVLPLLAMTPEVSLAELLGHMHHALTGAASEDSGDSGDSGEDVEGSASGEDGEEAGGCGGACTCGGAEETAEPELDVREIPHALRHATVFGALDAVKEGTAMVLVAPHDPLPLLAQLERRRPGAFAVEYLERGPETWRLRLRLGHRTADVSDDSAGPADR